MVSDLNRSKNFSKMKSPKSNGRSRRNKLSLSKDQQMKSPKKEQQSRHNETDTTTNRKIKSASWKRTTCQWDLPWNSKINKTNDLNDLAFPSLPTTSKPAILYSDVLFSGEKLKTPVKIKNLTPRHSLKINAKSRKRLISVEKIMTPRNKGKDKNCSLRMMTSIKTVETSKSKNVPKSAAELGECINKLMKRLNIDIPPWNFDDYERFNDSPEFICHFDDYNYLACENVALVGLRLASDGKLGF